MEKSLISCLCDFLSGRSGPLQVDVQLTPSDEIQQLRQQVAALTDELVDLRGKYNRVEYLYRCETLINARFLDFCREHSVVVPRSLFHPEDL